MGLTDEEKAQLDVAGCYAKVFNFLESDAWSFTVCIITITSTCLTMYIDKNLPPQLVALASRGDDDQVIHQFELEQEAQEEANSELLGGICGAKCPCACSPTQAPTSLTQMPENLFIGVRICLAISAFFFFEVSTRLFLCRKIFGRLCFFFYSSYPEKNFYKRAKVSIEGT